MEICNDLELFKRVKKAHILLPNEVVFSLSETIRDIPYGLSVTDNSLSITLLPENGKIDSKQKESKAGVYWSHKISFNAVSQSNTILKILDKYTSKNIVLALELKDKRVFVYGNSDQPLKYIFKEINSTNQEGLIGYEITVSGNTTAKPQITTLENFEHEPFLASWLSHDL